MSWELEKQYRWGEEAPEVLTMLQYTPSTPPSYCAYVLTMGDCSALESSLPGPGLGEVLVEARNLKSASKSA